MSEKQLRTEEIERIREKRAKTAGKGGEEEEELFAMSAEDAEALLEKQGEKRRRANAHLHDVDLSSYTVGARMKSEHALIESGAVAAAAGSQSHVDPLSYGTASVYQASEDRVDALVDDLARQAAKRGSSSRRRQHYEEDEVTYINDRNKVFNEKIARVFNKYTSEIKNNLERGTAL
mmetsp:Transcript_37937/g.87614  ORF Transcript_37937/g.87614 Transcript_37937/m.87614 type:complete len:177 (-) Transcript_37937:153-683(-)